MFWKMTNLQLKKGYIFPLYGDSAPFLRRFASKQTVKRGFDGFNV